MPPAPPTPDGPTPPPDAGSSPEDEHRAGLELKQGRLVLTRKLGRGAQGATYEAVDKVRGELVAVKEFRVRGARSWKDVDLAEREARVLSTLEHPSLPRHIDHFEEDGCLYLVMERIEGEPLDRILKERGHLPQEEVVSLLGQLAAILDYLHGHVPPVIHRDIKPGNIIRRPDGSYVLVDFGAVRDSLKPDGGSTVVGTYGYMAPEQFQGRALPTTDVYAAGATALASLTGAQPEDLPHQGLGIDVPAALGASADPRLVELLSAMLQPDPERRPARLAPLVAALGRSGSSAARAHGSASSVSWDDEDDEDDEGDETRLEDAAGKRHSRHARRRQKERRKQREREQRRRERHRRRRGRGAGMPPRVTPGGGGVALPLAVFLTLGLMVARVAVALALQVFVPLLLTILSVFLSRRLRESAVSVRDAGRRADAAMDRARLALFVGAANLPPLEDQRRPNQVEPDWEDPRTVNSGARVRIDDDARPDAHTHVSTRPEPTPSAGQARVRADVATRVDRAEGEVDPELDRLDGEGRPEDDAFADDAFGDDPERRRHGR